MLKDKLVRNKWFFVAFIAVLAIIGVRLEHTAAPNQEILIQFLNSEIAENQTKGAISLITTELKALDIDDLHIEQLKNGALKVSYYSAIELVKIKETLSQAVSLLHENSVNSIPQDKQLPFDKDIVPYQLDIYKIQDSSDLGGAMSAVLESKFEITRSTSYKTYAAIYLRQIEQKDKQVIFNCACYSRASIGLINAFHKIPESRAGPYSEAIIA